MQIIRIKRVFLSLSFVKNRSFKKLRNRSVNSVFVREINMIEHRRIAQHVHYAYAKENIIKGDHPTQKRFIIDITKTRLYNSDPLEPHFYIVKLGFTG